MRAIRHVANGGKYITPAVASMLADTRASDLGRPLHETLSNRELLVVCKIAQGKTPSEIAEEMSLSVKTVSTYRARALEKMGLRTTADLAAYAIRNGLVM